MRLALVHDFLNQFGGAERVLAALHEIYPMDPIFTSICDDSKLPIELQRTDIRTSFMQQLPMIMRFFRFYFMLYPIAFERFDLSGYDVILSSSSAYAKGVKKLPGQLHICYCHTPMRFVWRYDDYVAGQSIPGWIKNFLPFLLEPIRRWDLQTAANVDLFIANSRNVAQRIQQTYGRESVIINPPVDCEQFKPVNLDHDYFLVVSRLNSYKRIDLVVEAFNQLELPLKVVGSGPEKRKLQQMAGPNIEFLGRRTDAEVAQHLAECRALVFPGEEDFGIVPLEANASGRPVIAYQAGGALETVIDGKTGLFFEEQTLQSLSLAIKRFKFETFDKKVLRQHALKFDKEVFKRRIRDLVEQKIGENNK